MLAHPGKRAGGGLDLAVDRYAAGPQLAGHSRVPVHRLDDERYRARHRRADEPARSLKLGLVAVAAEVAGQEDSVHLVRLEQHPRDLREGGDVLLASAREIDRVDRRRVGREDAGKARYEGVGEYGQREA